MWFRPQDIHTDALDKIIASSRDRTKVDMVEVLMDIMEVKNLDEVSFCVNDLAGLMNSYNDKSEIRKIRRILKDSWNSTLQGRWRTDRVLGKSTVAFSATVQKKALICRKNLSRSCQEKG